MIRKEFILFALLFSFFSFSSCDEDAKDPLEELKEEPKEEVEKEFLNGNWEAVEYSYEYTDPTSGKTEKHTWPFSSVTQGCDVDFIKIEGVRTVLSFSEPNEENACETKTKNGKLEGEIIIFEGEEDRPRTILAANANYLKLKYKFNYEKYPKMACVVLYKKTDSTLEDVLPEDKSAYVGTWLAKDFTYKIPGATYIPPMRDASTLKDCANKENDFLIINSDNTVEIRFYRKACLFVKYKGKIDGDVIVFDEDKENPRTIVSYDDMFLSVTYKEYDHAGLIGENFVMRFEKTNKEIPQEEPEDKPTVEPVDDGIAWVDITGGTFKMGSDASESGYHHSELQHDVTLKNFKISKYAVTFEEYDAFCDATERTKPEDNWGRGKLPVINVSWDDAVAYAAWKGCRLPTEAEWEYACRAGTTTPFSFGNQITTNQANYNGDHPYSGHDWGENRKRTVKVDALEANQWGLHNMHGNVWEWCNDWHAPFTNEAATDPTGSASGIEKVVKGGAWNSKARNCRSGQRLEWEVTHKSDKIGFRLAKD